MQSRAERLRNLGVLVASSLLGGFRFNMVRAVWQPFVLSLGASMPVLGLLEGLAGHRGLVTALIQPFGGWFADRKGRKPFVALASVMAIIYLSISILAEELHAWWLLFPAMIAFGLVGVSRPARDSMTAESVSREALGTAYSAVMMAFIVPGIFAPALGGYIAERWGYVAVFAAGIGLDLLALILVLFFLRETLAPGANEGFGSASRPGPEGGSGIRWGRVFAGIFVPPRRLRGFYLATTVDSFVWGLGAALLYGMLRKSYGFTLTELGVMTSVFSLAWALAQMPVGRLVDLWGARRFLALSEAVGIGVIAGWMFARSFEVFLALQVGWALVAATWVPAMMAYLAGRVPSQERAEALGRMAAFRGIFSFPAPYVGGVLYQRWGIQGAMGANLIGVALALVLILALVKD